MEFNLDFKATEGRLIVKKVKHETTTSTGIMLPTPENNNVFFGTIVSVGELPYKRVQEFEVGQSVLWQQYSGCDVVYDGEDYVIINQTDILAVK